MPQLRLAMVQGNPTVGDLEGNADLVVRGVAAAAERGAQLVAFPEMFLTGYPVEDLALRPSFVQASRAALDRLALRLAAEGHGALPVVVGFLDRLDAPERLGLPRNLPQNAAAVLHEGRVVARYAKHHLPNYGVFDEYRYFVPGTQPCVVRVGGVDVALAICEDLWQEGGPVAETRASGAGLLLVVNGSPYERNKDDVRLELCQRRAADSGCTLAYVNMVGGQDELVFDGDSLVVAADGALLARAGQFTDELLVVDLELPAASSDRAARGAGRGARRGPSRHGGRSRGRAPVRRGRGLRRRHPGTTRLRPQERLRLGAHRAVRGHRLRARGGHRLRRRRRRARLRREPAQRVLLAALPGRRRRPGRTGPGCTCGRCRSRRCSTPTRGSCT